MLIFQKITSWWLSETSLEFLMIDKKCRNQRIRSVAFKCWSGKFHPISELKVTAPQSWRDFENFPISSISIPWDRERRRHQSTWTNCIDYCIECAFGLLGVLELRIFFVCQNPSSVCFLDAAIQRNHQISSKGKNRLRAIFSAHTGNLKRFRYRGCL